MDPNTQRAEAERWLGIAAKLLSARDFLGSKTFAIRARESDPNNVVSDDILGVVDTVIAGEKRVGSGQHPDYYAVLQLPHLIRDPELIASHYRRLVFLLNPDRNRLPFADYALQLAADAWSVLSDPTKKWLFDNELALHLQGSEQVNRVDPVRVDPVRVDPSAQLNTFQFFQAQPSQQHHQQQQTTLPFWEQQQHQEVEFLAQQQGLQQHMRQPQQRNQREFVSPPPRKSREPPPQWQMRDLAVEKGEAVRVTSAPAPPAAAPAPSGSVTLAGPGPGPGPGPATTTQKTTRVEPATQQAPAPIRAAAAVTATATTVDV